MTDYQDMSDLLEVFLEEAVEQLQRLDDGFLALEKNPGDLHIVNEVFRAAHTLKGSSATMGFEQMARLTHAMESLLDGVRAGRQAATPGAINALLQSVDILRVLVEQTRSGGEQEVNLDEALTALTEASDNKKEVGQVANAGSQGSEAKTIPDGCVRIGVHITADCVMPSVRGFMVFNALTNKGDIISAEPAQENMDSLQPDGTLTVDFHPAVGKEAVLQALQAIGEIEVTWHDSQDDDQKPTGAKASSETVKSEADSQSHAMQTVRVGVDRLDKLMNLVGELVIGRTRIGQVEGVLSAKYEADSDVGGLGEAYVHLGRVINELQEQIMRIRMLPVEQVFSRFPRMMRDLSQKANKKINFVISGQETELDRSILEDIVDPITHLLRNSVDHGIETAEERRAAGKPETATIRLVAKHEENRIVIEVEDDGHGISVEAVKAAAVRKGAISQEAADRLSEQESLQLIFGAGVSTAKEVTSISGRGVGMDVVKSNIERLSGSVDIHTEIGVGTRISLRLPLTLAIVQALITSAQDRIFAIPLTAVVETSRCKASDISTIEGGPVLQFRGSVLPIVNLQSVFPSRSGFGKQTTEDTIMVVVRAGGQLIGLAVDRLIGEQEVVIKSLGAYFGQVDGISGAALLGDGGIALIVDVSGLPALVSRKQIKAA